MARTQIRGRAAAGAVVRDVAAERIDLVDSYTELVAPTDERPLFENIHVRDLTMKNCHLEGAVLRKVTIHGVKADGLSMFVRACEFENVVLKGKVGTLIFTPELAQDESGLTDTFVEHLRRADRSTDIALDISEAWGSIEIRSYAASRIKLDPTRQAVMSLGEAQAGRWRDIDFAGSVFHLMIEDLLKYEWTDVVLAGSKESEVRVLRDLAKIGAVRLDA